MTQYYSPHIPITDRINYLCNVCVCARVCTYVHVEGGVKVKWEAKTVLSMLSLQDVLFNCVGACV